MDIYVLNKFKIIGQWEYNSVKDEMVLSPSASRIYFGVEHIERIKVDKLFHVLTSASKLALSNILTSNISKEISFLQKVHDKSGSTKDVLVIIKVNGNIVHGIVVDVGGSYVDVEGLIR